MDDTVRHAAAFRLNRQVRDIIFHVQCDGIFTKTFAYAEYNFFPTDFPLKIAFCVAKPNNDNNKDGPSCKDGANVKECGVEEVCFQRKLTIFSRASATLL